MLKNRLRQTSEWKDVPLEVRVYGKGEGSFILYDDDGTSYEYQEGEYSSRMLSTKLDDTGNLSGGVEELVSDSTWTYPEITWKYMTGSQAGKE